MGTNQGNYGRTARENEASERRHVELGYIPVDVQR